MEFNNWLLASIGWEGRRWSLQSYYEQLANPRDLYDFLGKVFEEDYNDRGVLARRKEWLVDREVLFERCQRLHINWCTPLCGDYPKSLLSVEKPPTLLSYVGEPCWLNDQPILSVVGSRKPDPAQIFWMESHLKELVGHGKMILCSGGARGVDQKAHSLCLRLEKPTVVWIPSGILDPYPLSLKNWTDKISQAGGAIVSCFSPDQPMYKWQFHIRNELIAAMGDITLVVEARRRSGTLVTAKYARDLGKDVAVVPCSPSSPTGLGGLDLIYDGAHMVRDGQDISLLLPN